MTSKATTLTQEEGKLERFPEYPPRDDMQNWLYLYETAVVTTLAIHYAGEAERHGCERGSRGAYSASACRRAHTGPDVCA